MILNGRIEEQAGGVYLRRVSARLNEIHDLVIDPDWIAQFHDEEGAVRYVQLPEELHPPQIGDILRLDLNGGYVHLVYRKASPHNSLFVTERCNSRCLMCSQPPRAVEDQYLAEEILEFIPLMSPDTVEIGITGGEPTLAGGALIDILRSLKRHLPATAVHLLSNGRLCRDPQWARAFTSVQHPDFMIGIPLYADAPWLHDEIVQAHGAFEETLKGLYQLGHQQIRIEIRMVVHQRSLPRLRQTAALIANHLPFVEQVAIMGLELMGFARSNLSSLWVEPSECGEVLYDVVLELQARGIRPLLFNYPLCLLPERLHPYAVQSISDWKNVYLPECEPCVLRGVCSGFFASTTLRKPKGIRAFTALPSLASVPADRFL